MNTGLQFDEHMVEVIEGMYKAEDTVRRRRAVFQALQPKPGERVLDIGTGPGFIAYEIADFVGPAGTVLGVDISEPMLQLARGRCAEKPWVQLKFGNATQLPVPDSEFDIGISVQVYEYIDDIEAALAELYRVLRPGGRAVIISTDWKSIIWNAEDESRMDRVLSIFAEHCVYQDLPRLLVPRLSSAGFATDHWQVVPQFNLTYDPNRLSYHLSRGLIRPFVSGRKDMSEQEAAAWLEDLQRLGEQGDYFFCLNQFLFVVTKPAVR
jgi:ubiquinone/menaquinone biosynthesis C-methylase UbiE